MDTAGFIAYACGISTLITSNPVTVRAPEQNTGPNVFYLGADRAVLDPLAAPVDGSYMFSSPDPHRVDVGKDLPIDPVTDSSSTWIVVPPEDGAKGGVYNIKSGAPGNDRSGKPFLDW